jgi:hypothetical protein
VQLAAIPEPICPHILEWYQSPNIVVAKPYRFNLEYIGKTIGVVCDCRQNFV